MAMDIDTDAADDNDNIQAPETREQVLPVILTSPEGVAYRAFFDEAQQRAYVEPPEASPGPGGLMLVSDIFSAPAATSEEAIAVLKAWGQVQGWAIE
jgi:hypothetical protein